MELDLPDVTQLLLIAGAEALTLDNDHASPLYKAIAFGHDSTVRLLLDYDSFLLIDEKVVHCAILSNNTLVIERCICACTDQNERDARAQDVMVWSSTIGRSAVAKVALENGAKLESLGDLGRTALLLAVENGHSAAVQTLVEAGASLDVKTISGMTLLQIAAASPEVFKKRLELIRHYEDFFAETTHQSLGRLPVNVTSASSESFFKCLSQWFDHEPGPLDHLYKCPEFMRALHQDQDSEYTIARLLDHGVDSGVKTAEGKTLLHLAVISPPRILKLLEKAPGLDINARDLKGRTPLHYAAAIGLDSTMQLLLSHGANATLRDSANATTLHFAITDPSCVKLALAAGFDAEAVDSIHRTPLHYLALVEEEQIEQVGQLLLEEGQISASAKDSQGATFRDYIHNPHYAAHSFGEAIQWIDSMSELDVLHPIKVRFMLRESSPQAAKDNLRFSDNMHISIERSGERWMVSESEDSDATMGDDDVS